jgi:acyl carrier protein
MDKKDIFTQVVDIIADKISVAKPEILYGKSLKDLGADSLDIVEIIMTLEEKFHIEISDEEAEKMLTIDAIVQYLESILK